MLTMRYALVSAVDHILNAVLLLIVEFAELVFHVFGGLTFHPSHLTIALGVH